jgi:hypothetical protein
MELDSINRIDEQCGLCSKLWKEHTSSENTHCNREMDLIQEQASDIMEMERQAYEDKHHCKLPRIPDFDEACREYEKICWEEEQIKLKKDKYLEGLLTPLDEILDGITVEDDDYDEYSQTHTVDRDDCSTEECQQESQWLINNPDSCPYNKKYELVDWAVRCKGFTKSAANKLSKKQLWAIWYKQ